MEITLNTETVNVTSIANPKNVINTTSEVDLLETAILFVPPEGHRSDDIILLSSIYTRLQTVKKKLKESQKTTKFSFEDKEWAIVKQQVKGMRWTIISPVIAEFAAKFND